FQRPIRRIVPRWRAQRYFRKLQTLLPRLAALLTPQVLLRQQAVAVVALAVRSHDARAWQEQLAAVLPVAPSALQCRLDVQLRHGAHRHALRDGSAAWGRVLIDPDAW